jgi:CTP:phosphocholine cytidylyltransferase-like protein
MILSVLNWISEWIASKIIFLLQFTKSKIKLCKIFSDPIVKKHTKSLKIDNQQLDEFYIHKFLSIQKLDLKLNQILLTKNENLINFTD